MKKHLLLPNLCRNSALLVIVLLSQLLVIASWLLLPSTDDGITALGLASIYALFTALLTTALLCVCRGWIARLNLLLGVLTSLALMVGSLLLVEISFQLLTSSAQIDGLDIGKISRRALAALILSAILLRFFALMKLFDEHSKAEAESRILALQSRIQPHFLFNSLNTISELAATDGEKAEAATTALASLFRASLENDHSFHSLQQEVTLCQRYLELERFRIQEKLVVEWHIAIADTERWRMPKLMLQPLLENALVHGQQASGKVFVSLDLRESTNHLSLMIKNKVGDSSAKTTGHGIAIKNIQQRLETLYDDAFTFRKKYDGDVYSVLLRIPKQLFKKGGNY